ncbi:hypothetical protein ABPG74_006391 [Tetrahymena malaccensis]
MIQNARPQSQLSTLLYLLLVNEQQFKKSCQNLNLKEFILELSSSNAKDNLSLKNLGNICFMLATGILLQYSQINSSLKDKVKMFAQSVLNEKDPKNKTQSSRATNNKTKRKNRTTTTNKKREDRDQLFQDVFNSARAIRMQSINNLENSLAFRNHPSYIIPNDMSLTYLLQNPLINPTDVLNEIQSYENSNQSSQKMNDVMEFDFLPQNNKIFEDIHIVLNSDQSEQSNQKLSSFPSDIQLQIVDNQWESISHNSNINKNQSIRQEVIQEIMDNGFLDQPVDEETAQTNLEEFERQQRLDLLRFQKQSTKKIQQELQNTNENLYTQLQNSTLKDRKIYKIKNTKSLQKTENNDSFPEFNQISSVNYNQDVKRKRGQKGRKNRDVHQKDKIKVILDTSIDQKINSSLNSSQDHLNTIQNEVLNSDKQSQYKQNSFKLNQKRKNDKKCQFEKPDSFIQQLEINSLQQLEQFSNFQQHNLSHFNPNEIQFKFSNFLSSELLTNQAIYHPQAQLDLIQNAISELDQTSNNLQKSQVFANQRHDQIFRTNLKADQSLNSSFSYPQQSSEYSSQIAAVMHGEKQFNEHQYLMEEYQQFPFNQKFSTQKKEHDSSSNQSKQDQTSQKSKSLQKAQSNQFLNLQPLANISFNQMQLNESKRNQISHLNELNNILDPIIEGQTSLMILQGMQDKSSLQCDGIIQSLFYMQDSLQEISSSNTNFDHKENYLQLSKEANQLLQMIVQKIKEKRLKKLELEKNFSGTQQVKSFLFYNLLSLKAADKIELIQKEQLNFSPIEIFVNENQA